MKYCFAYKKVRGIAEKADELLVEYKRKDATIPDFIELYKDKRIILEVKDAATENDLQIFKALCEKYSNVVIQLYTPINEVKKYDFPFYFSTYINTWDILLYYLSLGVTDVYIVEELGFELDKVSKVVHNANAQVRVFPNVAQSQWKEMPGIKKFFIRPEDVEYYEPYVDVFEFYGKDDFLATLYKVYNNDRKWFGPLNEIIIDLNSDLDGKYTIPRFGERRATCGRKCLKGEPCAICDRVKELSHTLEQAELIVKVDKNIEFDNK